MKKNPRNSIKRVSRAVNQDTWDNQINVVTGTLQDIQRDVILTRFKMNGYKKSATARDLGITRNTLDKRLQAYGAGEWR